MKFIIRLALLAAIAGTLFVMLQTGNAGAYVGGAAVILVLIWLFRKTVKPRARNRSGGSSYGGAGTGGAGALPAYSEVMQIINDYVGYYAVDFDCNITRNHIYIRIIFRPDTSDFLASQKAADLCNELSSTYGVGVSVN